MLNHNVRKREPILQRAGDFLWVQFSSVDPSSLQTVYSVSLEKNPVFLWFFRLPTQMCILGSGRVPGPYTEIQLIPLFSYSLAFYSVLESLCWRLSGVLWVGRLSPGRLSPLLRSPLGGVWLQPACLQQPAFLHLQCAFQNLLKSPQLTNFYHILFTTLSLSLFIPLLLASWGLCHIVSPLIF